MDKHRLKNLEEWLYNLKNRTEKQTGNDKKISQYFLTLLLFFIFVIWNVFESQFFTKNEFIFNQKTFVFQLLFLRFKFLVRKTCEIFTSNFPLFLKELIWKRVYLEKNLFRRSRNNRRAAAAGIWPRFAPI